MSRGIRGHCGERKNHKICYNMNYMIYELTTFFHLVGFALGFGGAMVSDFIFFSSIKDKKVTSTEFRFMQLGGKLVWIGLGLLFISGVGLVLLNPSILSSSKFLIKMVIVGVIAINGVIFHSIHLPHLRDHIGVFFHDSQSFHKHSHYLTMSGGVSVVSWFCAALLGSLPGLSYSFLQLLGVYVLLFLFALCVGRMISTFVFKKK